MADDTAHILTSQNKAREEELKCSEYICVQCIELENKLKNALEELKSTRLIIELLQHELSSSLTSKLTITGRCNIQETSNHNTNNEWLKVNHKRQEHFIKDNQKKKEANSWADQHLLSSNLFEILDVVNSDKDYGTNATIYKEVADNNLRNHKHCADVDVLNEQKEFSPKAVWNKSMQHASSCSDNPDISTPAKTTVKQ
jgi:hypothetical protein